jgi:cytochrome c peroxidase
MKNNFLSTACLIAILVAVVTGFSAFDKPGGKPMTKAELGKKLFFDPILSADSSVSCGSCHKPEFYFADTGAFSIGIGGKKTARNTPSVLNMAGRSLMFWDGRAASLEEQVLFPIRDHNEMNLSLHDAIGKLRRNRKYRKWFWQVFKSAPNEKLLGEAVATFEATLETSRSRFDLYNSGKGSMTEDEIAGQKIFIGKGKCFDCHFGPDFTGDEFKNIGLYDWKTNRDPGRFAITRDSQDLGKFKTPGLRNVAKTAPYMHDGRFRTLGEVIDFYINPLNFVPEAIGTDTSISAGITMTPEEKLQLEAFLRALTDPIPILSRTGK